MTENQINLYPLINISSWAFIPNHKPHETIIFKLLSNAPGEYEDAPIEGVRRILEIATGKSIPKGTKLDIRTVESIRMGTTVATKYANFLSLSFLLFSFFFLFQLSNDKQI